MTSPKWTCGTELRSLFASNALISKHIMPCLVDIINNTAVSMTCNSEPSLEEVKKIIYQHVCRPQDVKAIRVYCKLSITAMENQKQEDGCYCGQVHFQKLNVWFKFFNLRIYSTPKCGNDTNRITPLISTH